MLISCSYSFSTALKPRQQVKDGCKQGKLYGKAVGRDLLHLSMFHHLESDKEAYSFQICKYIEVLMFQVDYESLEQPA